ncbi:MAG TPA: class I SAM-dependent methyltransferase [Gaiellaceae bacterium]|jgi:hypothetical protein
MQRAADHVRFGGLTFDDFRRMACDPSLGPNERVGFPETYRAGAEQAILDDIVLKLPALAGRDALVVDIGPGSSPLSLALVEHCARARHRLVLVDSAEMLAHHPERSGVTKIPGRFPDCLESLADIRGRADAVLAYSVVQYAFAEASIFGFVDAALSLLAPGGRFLAGDVPNAAMRKRFLASAAGAAHHRAWSGLDEDPVVCFNTSDPGEIDDGVVLGLLTRSRAAGFHGWIVPQPGDLPMANRREDLLIGRP